MKTKTKEEILRLVGSQGQMRVHELVRELGISHVAVHKQLKNLMGKGRLVKIGRPPLVYYKLNKAIKPEVEINKKLQVFLESNYLYVSPSGDLVSGAAGFNRWLDETNQKEKRESLVQQYGLVRKQANKFRDKEGLIDLTRKLKLTFSKTYLNKVVCSDFYSLPQFGKTRLGNLLLYAKQSQDRELIKQIASETKETIKLLIKKYKVEAVVFVPATIPRKLQFLTEYKLGLDLQIPEVKLVKVHSGKVIVAQKTLNRLEERIVNARETIIVDDRPQPTSLNFNQVLIIDDAVGSGATLNEIAAKLKGRKIANKVIGYAVVGSFKGFDVIREV